MNSLERHVKNYTEYQRRLKETFGETDNMPRHKDIQTFIDCNNLAGDWGIVSSDVIQDIRDLILTYKLNTGFQEKKAITSYREYLDKLWDTFGIPKTMPDSARISEFIDEYKLFQDWGITAEDVLKDIQSFIDGKHDEMRREAIPIYKSVTLDTSSPRSSFTVASYSNYLPYKSNAYGSEAPLWDDGYYRDDDESDVPKKKVIVFIDAENISPKKFRNKYEKKIKKFVKKKGIDSKDIEFRGYVVDGGPTRSDSWELAVSNIKMIKIPGKPAKDKADKRIVKELKDQVGRETVCILITHDKKLQSEAKKTLDDVHILINK